MNTQRLNLQILFDNRWQPHTPDWCLATLAEFAKDKASLTKKLQSACSEGFNVEALHHELISAPRFGAEILKVEEGDAILHREVLLKDGLIPLVYACSLLPESALLGDYSELYQLGSRPLGDWLFSEPALVREPMQYASISAQRLAVQLSLGGNGPARSKSHHQSQSQEELNAELLGRKTLFIGAKKPFLVSEFFLPALVDRLSSS